VAPKRSDRESMKLKSVRVRFWMYFFYQNTQFMPRNDIETYGMQPHLSRVPTGI
jgi:hypothetical protein